MNQEPIQLSGAMQADMLKRALAYLTALGAQYHIVIGTEVDIDTFPVAPPKATILRLNNWEQMTGYRAKVKATKAADVLRWTRADFPAMAEKRDWSSFMSSLDEACRRYIGKGNFLLERGDAMVTVMREV